MADKRLNIINIPSSSDSFSEHSSFSRTTQMKEKQAQFERLWLIDPERFNPLRNCMEKERLERTWQLLTAHVHLKDKKVADIGCGAGIFSRRLSEAKAQLDAIDIAENALKHVKENKGTEHIQTKQESMPTTRLPEHTYDVIVCTELIAELPSSDYRLFFAELSRLIKPDGYLVCSSAIDIDSIGGLEKLIELAQTEFDTLQEVKSYHALYLRLKRLLEAPSHFITAWQDASYKHQELMSRQGFNRWWFWLNTTPLCVWFWYACHPLTRPLRYLLKTNRRLLLILEKMSRFFWDREGISHYLFIAKQRPLKIQQPEDIPMERPRRKEIWD